MLPWLISGTALLSWLLSLLLAHPHLGPGILDRPGSRSLHERPTPRTGGLAICAALVVGAAFSARVAPMVWLEPAVVLGTLLVAAISLLDDVWGLRARWRLPVHLLAAVLLVADGFAPAGVGLPGGFRLPLEPLSGVVAVLFVVWMTNLYNFMDGIDGIAGIEAVTVCLGGVLLFRLSSVGADEWMVPLLLASAVSGFLVWNFPRARIFMGDAGSGFVGLMLGLLSLRAGWLTPELFWGWVILLGVFVVDATTTLLRRLVRGERVYEAHCSHAYQRESRRLGSHVPVSLAIGGINLLWLLPVAAMVVSGRIDGAFGFILAYAPLVGLAIHCQAGKAE
jgi:Fuc2NAc and GlcNAc transferase